MLLCRRVEMPKRPLEDLSDYESSALVKRMRYVRLGDPFQPETSSDNEIMQHGPVSTLVPGERSGFLSTNSVIQQYQQRSVLTSPALQENRSQEQESEEMDTSVYDPELDEDKNPHYYFSNRILYEAHRERLLRNSFRISTNA